MLSSSSVRVYKNKLNQCLLVAMVKRQFFKQNAVIYTLFRMKEKRTYSQFWNTCYTLSLYAFIYYWKWYSRHSCCRRRRSSTSSSSSSLLFVFRLSLFILFYYHHVLSYMSSVCIIYMSSFVVVSAFEHVFKSIKKNLQTI